MKGWWTVNRLRELVRDDRGQDLIEYALLAGFISLVAILAITALGTGVNTVYGGLNTKLDSIPK
jgi:pilus assembly protein Flp/PilA